MQRFSNLLLSLLKRYSSIQIRISWFLVRRLVALRLVYLSFASTCNLSVLAFSLPCHASLVPLPRIWRRLRILVLHLFGICIFPYGNSSRGSRNVRFLTIVPGTLPTQSCSPRSPWNVTSMRSLQTLWISRLTVFWLCPAV